MSIAISYLDPHGVPRCGCPDFHLGANPKKWGLSDLNYCVVNRDTDLDSETWGMIAVVYIAGQSVVDVMKAYRFGDSGEA